MKQIEDAVYKVLKEIWPNPYNVIINHQRGPEPKGNYGAFHITSLEQVGRDYTGALASPLGDEVYAYKVRTEYSVTIRFTASGDDAGEYIFKLDRSLSNLHYLDLFQLNNLSFTEKSSVRKAPKLKETDWKDYYQLDATFYFAYEEDQEVGIIEQVQLSTGSPIEDEFWVNTNN